MPGTWYLWRCGVALAAAGATELEWENLMAGPDRRKIREWMIAECLRRRSTGVGDETLFAWMMAEGYNEMESLSLLAEALGWTGAGLRGQLFPPYLEPGRKARMIRANLPAKSLPGMRVAKRAAMEKGKPARRPDGDKGN